MFIGLGLSITGQLRSSAAIVPDVVTGDADWANVAFQSNFDSLSGGEVFDESAARRNVAVTTDVDFVNSPTMFGQGSLDMQVLADSRLEWDSGNAPLDEDWTLILSWLPDGFSGIQTIINRWNSVTGERGLMLRHDSPNNELDLLLSSDGTAISTQSAAFTAVAGTRYDIVATYDSAASTLKVWFNGALTFDLSSVTLNDTPVNWRIGSYGDDINLQSIVGQVDRVRLLTNAIEEPEATPTNGFQIEGQVGGIASWWSNHGIVLDGLLYVGTVDGGGVQHVWEINPTANVVTDHFALNIKSIDNDNNAPAIERLGNGNIIVAYTGENDGGLMRVRTGESLSSLGAETTLTTPGGTTFTHAQIYVRGNSVTIMTRVGSQKNIWALWYSDDNGANWSSAKNVFQNGTAVAYIMGRKINGDTVRFAMSSNPAVAGSLYLCDINLDTGNISAGGASLGNYKTSTDIPVSFSSCFVVEADLTGKKRRLLDISDDGLRILTYTSVDDPSDVDGGDYEMITVTDTVFGSAWTSETIRTSGKELDNTREYCGGAVFNRSKSNDNIVVSYEDAGTWRIREYQRSGAGSWTAGTIIDSGTAPLVRPYSPKNANANFSSYHQIVAVDYTSPDNYKGCYTVFSN